MNSLFYDSYRLYEDTISLFEKYLTIDRHTHFEYAKWTRFAHIEKEKDGDGQCVEVDAAMYPATFYRIRALAGVNSADEPTEAFTLTTGTGVARLVLDIAKAISEGMLAMHTEKGETDG